MFGGASGGNCATGIVGIATRPKRIRTSEQTDERIGRRMKVLTNMRPRVYWALTGAPSAIFWMPDTMSWSPALSPPLTM